MQNKRKRITNGEKIDIINQVMSGNKQVEVADESYQRGENSVTNVMQINPGSGDEFIQRTID